MNIKNKWVKTIIVILLMAIFIDLVLPFFSFYTLSILFALSAGSLTMLFCIYKFKLFN